ncbi:hypothetical protein V8E54_011556 [Elaphomyces granulatus]
MKTYPFALALSGFRFPTTARVLRAPSLLPFYYEGEQINPDTCSLSKYFIMDIQICFMTHCSFRNVDVFDRAHLSLWLTEHTVHRNIQFSKFLIQGSFHQSRITEMDPDPTPHVTVWMLNQQLETERKHYTLHYRKSGNCVFFPGAVALPPGRGWGTIDYVCSTVSPLPRPPSLYNHLSPTEFEHSLLQQNALLEALHEQEVPRANWGKATQMLLLLHMLSACSISREEVIRCGTKGCCVGGGISGGSFQARLPLTRLSLPSTQRSHAPSTWPSAKPLGFDYLIEKDNIKVFSRTLYVTGVTVTSPTNPIWASDDTIIDHDSEYTQLKVIRLIAGMDGSELKSLPTSTAYINYGSNICS